MCSVLNCKFAGKPEALRARISSTDVAPTKVRKVTGPNCRASTRLSERTESWCPC